jgi:hypothetical protein
MLVSRLYVPGNEPDRSVLKRAAVDDARERRNVLIQLEEVRRPIRNFASFGLPARFVAVMPHRSIGLGNELGAVALDEIAGLGDDVL